MLHTVENPRFVRQCALVVFLALCSLAPERALVTVAAAEEQPQEPADQPEPEYVEPLSEPLAVIPPGREDSLADMLGRGATLPGQCAFTSGKIDRDNVAVTYTCRNGPVVVTLRHPEKAAEDATLTEKFAIEVTSGSAPPGLMDELATRIRSREAGFEWIWLGAEARGRSTRVVIIALLASVALVWLVLRRRRAKAT
jgi:hypothetical protein